MEMQLATKNETTTLALVPQRELTPQIWQMISQMAPVMHQSRLFGVSSMEQATAIMLKGYELGISITASFEFIQVVQGKPGLSPRGALALLHNSPAIKKIEINALYDKDGKYFGHSCHMKRDNGFKYTAQFTLDDARRAGLIRPDSGWEKYPENMCMWRAVGFCADIVAPDITGGMTGIMKMPEAMGVALSQGGDVISVEAIPTSSNTEQLITLENLCNQYGAEAIMQANEGKIPQSQNELDTVAKKLGGE